eukprot:CAMPEP_0170862488 /NCGR_PEP_ID=MMETSP0734-20130129/19015_1 /TAXON_ID=186038 /ORGANISM="Fragilariopsis kerguelensis, Strain L26-C5" /LENGTH=63 /DNA_ID=CAMNT_0011237121 /DNA_START=378 /DNA_END=569 /DNA_ORIENTATION=+
MNSFLLISSWSSFHRTRTLVCDAAAVDDDAEDATDDVDVDDDATDDVDDDDDDDARSWVEEGV